MLVDIVSVEAIGDYRLHLRFEDGITGTVDISELIDFTGVFELLKDKDQFSQVKVNEELGILYWPNGADLDTDVLYSIVAGQPIPKFDEVFLSSS